MNKNLKKPLKSKKSTRKKPEKISKLWKEASKTWQDYHRKKTQYCYSCGKRAQVLHHHFTFARSVALRFENMNCIPLCTSCHYAFHSGSFRVKLNYEKKMKSIYGEDWEDKLLKIDQGYVKRTLAETREFLYGIIIKYR